MRHITEECIHKNSRNEFYVVSMLTNISADSAIDFGIVLPTGNPNGVYIKKAQIFSMTSEAKAIPLMIQFFDNGTVESPTIKEIYNKNRLGQDPDIGSEEYGIIGGVWSAHDNLLVERYMRNGKTIYNDYYFSPSDAIDIIPHWEVTNMSQIDEALISFEAHIYLDPTVTMQRDNR